MAVPAVQVQSASVSFADEDSLQPLIGGATVATTYYTGELMGRRSDGYVTRLDDSAPLKYLGILKGPRIVVSSSDANGFWLATIANPRFIEMDLDSPSGTVTRAGSIGLPVYAATVTNGSSAKVSLSPGVNGNLVGTIEDVVASDPATIGSATRVLIRPANASTGLSAVPLVVTAAATLTSGYANKPILLNNAAGFAITLPVASGSGNEYQFYVGTTVTSVGITISDGSAHLYGLSVAGSDKSASQPDLVGFVAAGSTTITLNGTTKGGIVGDKIVIRDIATNKYVVNITGQTTGTAVTPFS